MIIVGEQSGKALSRYMYQKIGLPIASDTRYIGALSKENLRPLAVVAYNTWLEDSVFMHVAVEQRRFFRQFLREAFIYPFVACNKSRVYGMTPITSQQALRLSRRLGFREISRTPDFVLQVMEKSDCRWISDATDTAGTDATAGADVPTD